MFSSLTNKEQNLVSKQKLLLADDSVTIQKVVNLTFADEGIEVISVGDGDSAMEKILETSPDLIMVDVNMPGLNGYEICEKLRNSETFRNTPVILLVGSFEPFDEDEAKRVGADDYLTKPFQSIRQLVQKVTALLTEERSGNGFVAPKTPEIEVSTPIEETTQEIPVAEDKFAETLETYSTPVEDKFADTLENYPPVEDKFADTLETYPSFVEDKKDDFGDVANDDEMIQTSQFSALPNIEIPRFESEPIAQSSLEIKPIQEEEPKPYIPFETDKPYVPVETDDEPKPYIPIETDEESKPYIPVEHDAEPKELKPYQPIETEPEEPKPYIPIENNFEIDEPKPYIPIETESEIADFQKVDNEVMTVDKSAETSVPEVIEEPAETHDVSLPEMASILQLDEQNLLEIAPREEDFIINMDHEQNSSADWDLIETRSFTDSQIAENVSQDVDNKDFAIVTNEPEIDFEKPTEKELEPEIEEPADENDIKRKIEESECVDLPAIEPEIPETEEVVEETVEENEYVEEIAESEKNEVIEAVSNSEVAEINETVTEPEEVVAEKEVEETVEDEETATKNSSENVVSVPNFIASTVVSEVSKENVAISEELIEVIVNRVMERLSDNVVREIAWEIVPSHTDLIIKKMVQEKLDKD
jgi:CheY-like chemotaxis protein